MYITEIRKSTGSHTFPVGYCMTSVRWKSDLRGSLIMWNILKDAVIFGREEVKGIERLDNTRVFLDFPLHPVRIL